MSQLQPVCPNQILWVEGCSRHGDCGHWCYLIRGCMPFVLLCSAGKWLHVGYDVTHPQLASGTVRELRLDYLKYSPLSPHPLPYLCPLFLLYCYGSQMKRGCLLHIQLVSTYANEATGADLNVQLVSTSVLWDQQYSLWQLYRHKRGSVYFTQSCQICSHYSKAASIQRNTVVGIQRYSTWLLKVFSEATVS